MNHLQCAAEPSVPALPAPRTLQILKHLPHCEPKQSIHRLVNIRHPILMRSTSEPLTPLLQIQIADWQPNNELARSKEKSHFKNLPPMPCFH